MSRRGENIHKRKDGRWEARYEKGRTEKGTIIYGFLYGKSYREAKAKKLQALQKQMTMQRSKNYSAFQIQELSSLWLEYVHFNLKESTYMCYVALVQKHIVPYFKKNPQQLLSKNGLQIFYNDKIASGLSTQSVKMILMLLERILAFSEEQEFLPTVKRTKVHSKTIPFEKDLLSPEELSLLSRHLAEADTAFAAGVLLCMYTGIRIGDDDDKIRLNQRKPSKYKGLRRFGPEKNLQRINKFMKERPIFYKNLIQMKENIRFYLRCFYCITKVMILQFNSENRTELARNG